MVSIQRYDGTDEKIIADFSAIIFFRLKLILYLCGLIFTGNIEIVQWENGLAYTPGVAVRF